jgi:beta-glucosidase
MHAIKTIAHSGIHIKTKNMCVIFGKYKPGGHLPIELPSSMEAVRNQKEDVPYDSKDPLYKFGFGLSY